jgi:hypothetical protein
MKRTLFVITIFLVLCGCASEVITPQSLKEIRVKKVYIENVQCSDPAAAVIFRESMAKELAKDHITVYDGLTKHLAQVVIISKVSVVPQIQDNNETAVNVETATVKALTQGGEEVFKITWNNPRATVQKIAADTARTLSRKLRHVE